MLDRVGDWKAYLQEPEDEGVLQRIRERSRTGRPSGSDDFIHRLEALTGKTIRIRRAGRKPAAKK